MPLPTCGMTAAQDGNLLTQMELEACLSHDEGCAAPGAASIDLLLQEQIEQALRATGYQSLRLVEFVVAEGLVVLRGTLPSYYMKQLALAAVLAVQGVVAVRNDALRVIPAR